MLNGLQRAADSAGIPFTTTQAGGMFGCFFNENRRIESLAHVMDSHVPRFRTYFHLMLAQGVYLAPSAFEAGFISQAHSEEDIAQTIAAAARAFGEVAQRAH